MDDFPSGAAARLLITPNALRRHARRAQRELEALGVCQNLAASQTFLARVLGMKTWNEAIKLAEGAAQGPSPSWSGATTLASVDDGVPGAPFWPEEPPCFEAATMEAFLVWAYRQGSGRVHVQTLDVVRMDVYGHLQRGTRRRLTHPEVLTVLDNLAPEREMVARWKNRPDQDLSFSHSIRLDREHRLRLIVNACSIMVDGQTGLALNFRLLPDQPPRLEHLNLPDGLVEHLFPSRGMVVVAGPTGVGKSTLLAGAIQKLVEEPGRKIVTYESPVEFVYDEGRDQHRSSVTQSEVGRHVASFADGVRNALRRNPDVILIGECRDHDTVEATLAATTTGHAVYTAVSASSVIDVVRRMVLMFPKDEQDARRVDLLNSLKLVVAQMLVPSVDGKRVALREYLALDMDLVDRMLRDPLAIPALIEQRLTARGTSFEHDARAKYAAGVIDDRTLNQVLTMVKARRRSEDR